MLSRTYLCFSAYEEKIVNSAELLLLVLFKVYMRG